MNREQEKRNLLKKLREKDLRRDLTVEFVRDTFDDENLTVEIAISSDAQVERWGYIEILDHKPAAIRQDRLKMGIPILLGHDRSMQVGILEPATVKVGKDGKIRGTARFSKNNPRAVQEYNDAKDGIRIFISVGYMIHELVLEKADKDGPNIYRVTDWEPMEASFVSIPADPSVGVGRTGGQDTGIVKPEQKENKMDKDPQEREEHKPDESRGTPPQPPVNLDEIRQAARDEEQERIKAITTIATKVGMTDLGRQFVDNGKSMDEFRAAVLEQMGAKKVEDPDPKIGMTKQEIGRYSILKAVRAMAFGQNEPKYREEAGFEREVSAAVGERLRKSPQGFFIPHDVTEGRRLDIQSPDLVRALVDRLTARDLVVGTTTAGGYTVATDLLGGSFIELLRNLMLIRQMGATILGGLVGDVAIPGQSGGATAYWVAESGAPAESQQTIKQVGLTPKTVGALTDISRKLILQSAIDVESFVATDLALVTALAIDLAAINGSGASNQPTGILNTTGIGDVAGGTNGLAPIWAHMVNLWREVAIDNAAVGSLGFLTNSKVVAKLMTTDKGTDTGKFIIENFPGPNGMTALAGARCGVSNQVPSNLDKGTSTGVCSAVVFGNFADLVIGQWGGVDLLTDPYTGGGAGTVRVRILQDVDIAVRHAESFVAMKDALTT